MEFTGGRFGNPRPCHQNWLPAVLLCLQPACGGAETLRQKWLAVGESAQLWPLVTGVGVNLSWDKGRCLHPLVLPDSIYLRHYCPIPRLSAHFLSQPLLFLRHLVVPPPPPTPPFPSLPSVCPPSYFLHILKPPLNSSSPLALFSQTSTTFCPSLSASIRPTVTSLAVHQF